MGYKAKTQRAPLTLLLDKIIGDRTGLGLSVTRSIVDIHNGTITLENRRDEKGACARLCFPASWSNN